MAGVACILHTIKRKTTAIASKALHWTAQTECLLLTAPNQLII